MLLMPALPSRWDWGQVVYSKVLEDHTGILGIRGYEIEGYSPALLSNPKGLSTEFFNLRRHLQPGDSVSYPK